MKTLRRSPRPMHAVGLQIVMAGLFAVSAAAHAARADRTLIVDGKSEYTIVLSANPSPAALRGAQEIQSHLLQMTGVEVPIVTDPPQLPERAIVIGAGRLADVLSVTIDPQHESPEAFTIKTAGPHIVILGNSPRGTLYGCTALLETLGVRWYTPVVTRIPTRTTVSIPDTDETQSPDFEYREPFFFEAFDRDWASRLRINGHHADLDESTGGQIVYGRFVHTLKRLIPDRLFDEHPEYFPLIDGQRRRENVQRCLTNPEVLRLTVARVRNWIRQNPDATIFSVSQNDGGGWCRCASCEAIAEKFGGRQSGVYLWFVNQVAEAIVAEHPGKLIDTLAYQFTEAPPTGIKPRANVRVRLCPIACCQAHPYEQCAAEPNRRFIRNLRRWAALTDTMYVWHYNTNFANYLMPFPDFNQFPAEARLYKRRGVKGVFFQGAYAPGGGGSDSELRAYVMARLLWDVDVDTDALVSEWMAGVYGTAAEPMRRWFDLLHQKVSAPDAHFFIYDPPTVHYMSADVIAEGDRLFDQAETLAADDPVAAEYIRKARLGLRYVKLMQQPRVDDEFRRFLADVREFGITQLREGQPLEEWEQKYLDAHGSK